MTMDQDPEASSDKDTKQQILDATVDLIREEGIECVTLRRIATKAKVNLALVNYHYRSKDNLLDEAVRTIISRFDAAFRSLEDESLPPKERLKRFLGQYIGQLRQYRGMAKHMINQSPSIMGSLHKYSQYSKTIKMQNMHKALREITGEQNEEQLSMMMFQLHGALLMPLIMYSCKESAGMNEHAPFITELSVEAQLDCLFDHYFYRYGH